MNTVFTLAHWNLYDSREFPLAEEQLRNMVEIAREDADKIESISEHAQCVSYKKSRQIKFDLDQSNPVFAA